MAISVPLTPGMLLQTTDSRLFLNENQVTIIVPKNAFVLLVAISNVRGGDDRFWKLDILYKCKRLYLNWISITEIERTFKLVLLPNPQVINDY